MITANLQHPAIVPVYEVGRWPSGEPFYAMKLVRGRPLAERLPVATTSARAALLRAFLVACEAMAYAHERGVVHRDLKPANLVIGEHGETQVVDWGLATTVGATDRPVGTPGYMSPEQGAGAPIGPASDVWSLGVILREIVGPAPPPELRAPRTIGRVPVTCAAAPVAASTRIDPTRTRTVSATARILARIRGAPGAFFHSRVRSYRWIRGFPVASAPAAAA